MSIAKTTEIIASSPTSFQDAIDQGIARARRTLKHITGAWIGDQTLRIDNGNITEYRVRMKITFVLED